MNNNTYVTTAIPYVNGKPHIGFALELVQADIIARYNRLIGNDTQFQTGTDENAFKNVLSAREQGITTQELADNNSAEFVRLCDLLSISQDKFVRTTSDTHARGVELFWRSLKPDDLYRKKYAGLYCTGCEDFVTERDLSDGICPDHGVPPTVVEEENWFFRLSAYQDHIDSLITSGRLRIVPESRKNEILAFVRRGLHDISVSRRAERSGGWGIPVPDDGSQIIYVWIDALINYLSGRGYGWGQRWTEWWDDARIIHCIGKNVWKFHAVYWPALLESAGLRHPDELQVHGFLTVNGHKISKSKGATVDPFECIDALGVDAVRLYLCKSVPPAEDGDFSEDRLRALYVSDLANGLGNLVSRIATLCDKCEYGEFDAKGIPVAPASYHEAVGQYRFDVAISALWHEITTLNQAIEREAPWNALRTGDHDTVRKCLSGWLQSLHGIAYWLEPFLPDASRQIRRAVAARPITRITPLFPK